MGSSANYQLPTNRSKGKQKFDVFWNNDFGIISLCTVFIVIFKSKSKTKILCKSQLQNSFPQEKVKNKETNTNRNCYKKPPDDINIFLSLGYVSGSINYNQFGKESNMLRKALL